MNKNIIDDKKLKQWIIIIIEISVYSFYISAYSILCICSIYILFRDEVVLSTLRY